MILGREAPRRVAPAGAFRAALGSYPLGRGSGRLAQRGRAIGAGSVRSLRKVYVNRPQAEKDKLCNKFDMAYLTLSEVDIL